MDGAIAFIYEFNFLRSGFSIFFFFWKREIHSFIIRRVHYEHLIGENNGQSIMLESTMSPHHIF